MIPYAQHFGEIMVAHIAHLINRPLAHTHLTWLPITHGGLGIGNQAIQCLSAYLASSISSYQFLVWNNIMPVREFNFTSLTDLCRYFQLKSMFPLDTTDELWARPYRTQPFLQWMTRYAPNDVTQTHHSLLQNRIYNTYQTEYINQFESKILPHSSKSMQQRYHSSSFDHSDKFLLAIPVIPPLAMSDEAFRTAMISRLHLPHFPQHLSFSCDCYRNTSVDEFGDHLLTCSKITYLICARHHALVRLISKMASSAGVFNRVEPRRALRDDSDKRPDKIFYNSHLHRGATVAIDVSITHPVSIHLPAKPGVA
jgi:hypothetical protein